MGAECKPGARLALVALAAAAGAVIAGCGGDDPVSTSSSASTSTSTSTTEAPGTNSDAASAANRADERKPESANAPEPVAPPGADPEPATGGGSQRESEPESGGPSLTKYELTVPDGAHGLVWVRRGAKVPLRTEPGGGRVAKVVGKRTDFGSPTVFGVVKQIDGWAGVSTPYLPNGQLAWLRLDPKRINAGWTHLSIVVDLSARRAALRKDDRVLRSFAVTVGAPGVETPTGRFAVTDTFRGDLDPAAYGCCALALSATQPHLPSGWLGGNRIAIHGTYGPLGVAASHGCVRAANEEVSALVDRVPLGTPVFIRG